MKKATSNGLLLLDLNVLLALAWPNHQFHAVATERMQNAAESWSTCALTQLGFIRLSSNPAVVGVTRSPGDAAALLEVLVADSRHQYLDSLPSFPECFDRIVSSKQVTDVYLLSLAQHHGARLLTFDRRVSALASTEEQVEILSPQG